MKPFDSLIMRGKSYSCQELEVLGRLTLADSTKAEWEKDFFRFVLEWIHPDPVVQLWTSGTTGNPKNMIVQKERMAASAVMTQKALGLKKNDAALLCLPLRYVAGKMFIVRAFVLGLNLDMVRPSMDPMADYRGQTDFCAMTPPQLLRAIEGNGILRIRKLIVGGAPIEAATVGLLQSISTEVVETYGMTETLTHVALRPLNGPSASTAFHALDGVSFRQDERGALVINAPSVNPDTVFTNDLVALSDPKTFKWLGRADNIINSGGVKIIPEQVESKLTALFPAGRFFVAGVKDSRMGERVALFVEGGLVPPPSDILAGRLPPYERPSSICRVADFIRTDSGKINREETLIRYASESCAGNKV